MAHDLLVEIVIDVEDVRYFERVLMVEFDVVEELFPYVLIV